MSLKIDELLGSLGYRLFDRSENYYRMAKPVGYSLFIVIVKHDSLEYRCYCKGGNKKVFVWAAHLRDIVDFSTDEQLLDWIKECEADSRIFGQPSAFEFADRTLKFDL